MMNADLDVNGWNNAYVSLLIASGVYARHLKSNASQIEIRFLIGFEWICYGLAVRIGGWLPWRVFLYSGDTELAAWWKSWSSVWTSMGALMMTFGIIVLMMPALQAKFGRWAIPMVALFEGLAYGTGYVGSWIIGETLKGW